MAQVKKAHVREAILEAAHALFKNKGYLGARMSEIAAAAGTSVANIYHYFPSKLHLFYEIYMPIMVSRMMKLGAEVKAMRDPRAKLRRILLTLWRDIPNENNGFAHNLMQAIVTAPPELEKPHDPLRWCENYVSDLMRECLPAERRYLLDDGTIAFLAWMAFDGFAVNFGKHEERDVEALASHFADLLLGRLPPAPGE